MAVWLDRLGRAAFQHRRIVIALWLALLIGIGIAAAQAPSAPAASTTIPGTQSQAADDLLAHSFGVNPNGATAQLVFVAPHGEKVTARSYEAAMSRVMADAARSSQVASVITPAKSREVSPDRSTAVGEIVYKVPYSTLTTATTTTLKHAAQQGRQAGLTVEIGGTALSATPADKSVAVSVAIAFVVLVLTFASFTAAGLPLLSAGIGVAVSVLSIIALSGPLGLSSTTKSMALMLGLAVGIDYALLIVSRYREQRQRGMRPLDAAGFATGTAGSAVVFAGLTVIIALVGLSVVGIPNVTKMGLSAAGAVAVAVLVALTVIPALLGFAPNAVLVGPGRPTTAKPSTWRFRRRPSAGPGHGSRWAQFVLRHPLPILLTAIVGLGVLAVPVAHMKLGNAGNATLPSSNTARRAYDDITRAFGAGHNGPLTIVVSTRDAHDPRAAAATIAKSIGQTPGVLAVSKPRFNTKGDLAEFTAIPAHAPDSTHTTTLVNTIRSNAANLTARTGASYMVTGLTAANIDIAHKVSHALLPYILTVVGLAFLILTILFRSVLVPLKATLGFVLSLAAALGTLVAVFQWGWLGGVFGVAATGPVQSMMPIFMIGIAFGLAMDYQVFLVSRIREAHTNGEHPSEAVVTGFQSSARVIVAAALIMTSVFAGFVASDDVLVKMIGFGLAVAVLCDAFVVRMTIVPAMLALLGHHAWRLPSWIDRRLPHLDIEGKALETRWDNAIEHLAPSRDRELADEPTGA